MKRAEGKSLKEKLFLKVVIAPLLGFLVMGGIFAYLLYDLEIDKAKSLLKQRNQTIAYFLSAYFSRLYKSLELLSGYDVIIRAPWLSEKERDRAREILLLFQRSTPGVYYIYAGYRNGYLLINNYVPPKNFDPTVRPWYRAALKSAPDSSNGILYREIKTKEWLFSVSRALRDRDGNITGVLAIDASVERIKKLLEQKFGHYKTASGFILKKDGSIIDFGDRDKAEKLPGRVKERILDSHASQGSLIYSYDGEKRLIYYSYLKELGWYVVTMVDRWEILSPILMRTAVILLFFLLYTLIFGWMLSGVIVHEVIEPLNSLKKEIDAVVAGEEIQAAKGGYPSNEIGAIAEHIGKLTRSELFRANRILNEVNRQLEFLSTHDELTKLLNRRKIIEELNREWERAQRYGTVFSIIFFDIDHFKQINDTYGHSVGDEVLKTLAETVSGIIRKTDRFARWGGEEFLILCPETDAEGAAELAEHIRKQVREKAFPRGIRVTLSLAVVQYAGQESIEAMLSEVDQKLYRAKRGGRNRVTV